MVYDVAFWLEKKWKLKKVNDFTVKLRDFCYYSIRFQKNYTKIIPNLLDFMKK